MKTKNYVLYLMLVGALLYVPISTKAQVTIGSEKEPSKAALLDLKTTENTSGGATTDKGGLLFPRVNLENPNSLKPFIASGGDATDKAINKGLVVYNLKGDTPFKGVGLYEWNGTTWLKVESDITASNGVRRIDNDIQLGGPLTKPTWVTGDETNSLILFGEKSLTYKDGKEAPGKVLTSAEGGAAQWGDLSLQPAGAMVVGTANYQASGMHREGWSQIQESITLPPGEWIITYNLQIRLDWHSAAPNIPMGTHISLWNSNSNPPTNVNGGIDSPGIPYDLGSGCFLGTVAWKRTITEPTTFYLWMLNVNYGPCEIHVGNLGSRPCILYAFRVK